MESTEELRIKVAKLCGHVIDKPDEFPTVAVRQCKCSPGVTKHEVRYEIPDYCNNLKACHEFEKTLSPFHRVKYVQKLENQVAKIAAKEGWSFALIHATAEQRCRAFVATMEASKPHENRDSSGASDAATANMKTQP